MVRIPGFKTLSTLFLLGLALASTSLQAPAPNLAIGDLGRLPETVESGFKNVVIPVAHKISTKVKSIFHVKNLVDATAKSGEKKYEYGKKTILSTLRDEASY